MDILTPHPFARFRRVENWIFDLDNTLYPAGCNLFAQIDQRMSAFIAKMLDIGPEEARRLQKEYYFKYGTTLGGLMAVHSIRPERFLEYVHDIDLSPVPEAPDLGAALARLPGRKFIFTNGSRRHADRVAAKLGVLHLFDDVFDIAASDYVPKPRPEAYARFLARHGVPPRVSAMFEDLPHNLESPHALGMATVLVRSTYDDHPSQQAVENASELPPHIHHVTDDLTAFLQQVLAETGASPAQAEPGKIDVQATTSIRVEAKPEPGKIDVQATASIRVEVKPEPGKIDVQATTMADASAPLTKRRR